MVSDRLTMGSTETACVILPPFSHRPTPPSSLVKEHQPTAKAPQDTPTTAHVSDVDVGSHLAERLVVAIEKLISAKAAPNTASEEKKPPAKEGNLQTARASKLEYKHVDEVYAPMPPCRIMTDSMKAGTRKQASTVLPSRQILGPINLINTCLSFGTESVSLPFIRFLKPLTGLQIRIPWTRLPSWISSPHYYVISCERSARISVTSP